MAGDLAIFPYPRVFLYFNKRSDFCVVSNFAPVQIDKFGKLDSAPQFHARPNRTVFIHNDTNLILALEVLHVGEAFRRLSAGTDQADL